MVRFAAETRAKNQDWEVELGHGSTAGTKYKYHDNSHLTLLTVPRVVPVQTAGCYVPGGLYGYTVAAIMTAGVAR